MLFCSLQNEHFISSPCANFPDSQKADIFSQFIERMLSYVALGCSPLWLNKCSSCNFNAIYLFRNWEEAGWFVLQNVPLLGIEQGSTIQVQWFTTSTSPWSLRKQTSTALGEPHASEWGFICIIAALHHSLIAPRRDSLACFSGNVCSYITHA